MRIITATSFTLELNIANIDQIPVQERVTGFIDKYTQKFLKQLYGVTMGQLFIDALPDLDNTNRFWVLANDADLQNALASYVYYWYQRDGVSFTSGQGEKRSQAANSTDTQIAYKIGRAWSDLVEYSRNIAIDTETFPEYVKYNWYFADGTRWYDRGYSPLYEFEKREIYFYLNPIF